MDGRQQGLEGAAEHRDVGLDRAPWAGTVAGRLDRYEDLEADREHSVACLHTAALAAVVPAAVQGTEAWELVGKSEAVIVAFEGPSGRLLQVYLQTNQPAKSSWQDCPCCYCPWVGDHQADHSRKGLEVVAAVGTAAAAVAEG